MEGLHAARLFGHTRSKATSPITSLCTRTLRWSGWVPDSVESELSRWPSDEFDLATVNQPGKTAEIERDDQPESNLE